MKLSVHGSTVYLRVLESVNHDVPVIKTKIGIKLASTCFLHKGHDETLGAGYQSADLRTEISTWSHTLAKPIIAMI
jgi:hypothetical protein